jgi:signal transduction histidine kinase
MDFGELVAEAVAEVTGLANQRRVRIELAAEPGNWCGVGDRARLRHVLYNLLDNAIKFTPEGGRADVSLEGNGYGFQIRVSDNGIGFPTDRGPMLFERFEQRDRSSKRVHGGLGVGLALAKTLIELHGGAISAASEGPGRGATFTVTLPHARLASTAPGPAS